MTKALTTNKKHMLAPGHRGCAGCGELLAARLVADVLGDDAILVCCTGCLEVTTTPFPESSWEHPWIHSLFENSASVASGVEAALKALGREKTKVVAMGGDGGTIDIGMRALSGMFERYHDILYCCYDNEAYMNCLALSTEILTEDGLKKITEINVGDMVYAFNQKTHELVLKECSGVFNNGCHNVYELNSLHHTIKATSNHPFLTVQKRADKKDNFLVWKTLAELKTGDSIIVLKNNGNGESDQTNHQNLLAKNKHFETEEVQHIKLIGREQTLDLRVEDEHNFIADGIVVHNTGIQRSGSTPLFGSTTTSPAGKASWGNDRPKKWLPDIALAHNIPYVATATVTFYADLQRKVKKALTIEGPKYIQIHVPCPTGWYYDGSRTIELARLAYETALFPIVEIDNQDPLNPITKVRKIKERKPVEEYLQHQGRFRHLFKKEEGAEQIKKIQAWADYMAKKYNLDR